MRKTNNAGQRRGSIVPLLAVTLVAMIAMVALAVDIGLVALARNQCQNAADIAAMSGVRQLNGDTTNNNNYSAAGPAASTAAQANTVINQAITDSNVSTTVGWYAYNAGAGRFQATFGGTLPVGQNWTAVQATVTMNTPTYFSRVFNISSMPVTASATSVHRPRDVAIVLDTTGSMRFSSQTSYPPSGDYTGSLNPDPNIPRFGHWSAIQGNMQRTTMYVDSGGETHAANNLTMDTVTNGPAVVKDFLYKDSSGNFQNAFVNTSSPYNAMTWACPAPSDWDVQSSTTAPYVGDQWPRLNKSTSTSTSYATTVEDYLTGSNTAVANSAAKSLALGPGGGAFDPLVLAVPLVTEGYGPNFKGYVMGPGYYGKSFFMWPPDPRFTTGANPSSLSTTDPKTDSLGRFICDWRQRFFYKHGTTTPCNDNSLLWDSLGNWLQAGQSSSYDVNYNAVIAWLTSGPQVLPPNLRAGRLVYYSAIPTTIPSSGGTQDQMFWRDYINYVIGAGSATSQKRTGYGRETSGWGTVKITAKSSLTNLTPPYMHYNDNPIRPRMQMWFGPLSMLAFLGANNDASYARNWWPGTCHEAQCWQLKAGIQSALSDIEKNHPNDWASLIFFSDIDTYSTARVSNSRNYATMQQALFFPFSLLSSLSDQTVEIRPYDTSYNSTVLGDVPNATSGTGPAMGFMVAYNQFSTATGFSGRRGAAKVVIFETDGVPNTTSNGSLVNAGAYLSYYNNISGGSYLGNGNATVTSGAITIVNQLCASDSAGSPGYSTSKVPVRVHAIGFGDLFSSGSTTETQARTFLLQVQQAGNTSAATDTAIESYKIITGNYDVRIPNLKTTLQTIMQSGVQVSLIQ